MVNFSRKYRGVVARSSPLPARVCSRVTGENRMVRVPAIRMQVRQSESAIAGIFDLHVP